MRRELWLDKRLSEKQCKPYDYYIDVYFEKVIGVFDNIERESDEAANRHFEELGEYFSPEETDMDFFVDSAFNKGLEHFETVSLVQYNVKLMWFSTMYQFWEQQVRFYLYREGGYSLLGNSKDGKEVSFKSFCTSIKLIKEEFLKFGHDIKEMNCWNDIDELRLLANVIKHGDGGAATQLMNKRADFFYDEFLGGNTFDLYGTALNEKTLIVEEKQLILYKEALQSFWKELYEQINFKTHEKFDLF